MGNLQVQGAAEWAQSSIDLVDITRIMTVDPGTNTAGLQERRLILDILFMSAVVISNDSLDKGNTIWVREASNRATEVLCLMLLVSRQTSSTKRLSPANSPLVRTACILARNYRAVMEPTFDEVAPCETLLGDIVSGLIEIFNTGEAHIDIDMHLNCIRIEGPCRSALILIVSEIVMSVLKYAVDRMSGGRLSIFMSHSSRNVATLIIKTPATLVLMLSATGYEIICALAGVLKAELLYKEAEETGAIIEFRFPCVGYG